MMPFLPVRSTFKVLAAFALFSKHCCGNNSSYIQTHMNANMYANFFKTLIVSGLGFMKGTVYELRENLKMDSPPNSVCDTGQALPELFLHINGRTEFSIR